MNYNDLFLNASDVNLKLSSCVVKYKGNFYLAGDGINTDAGEVNVYLNRLPAPFGRRSSVPANSKELTFNLTHLLGWTPFIDRTEMEHMRPSRFLSRTPVRRNKLGLAVQNLVVFGAGGTDDREWNADTNTLISTTFLRMLERTGYLSTTEVYEKLIKQWVRSKVFPDAFIALTPSFAVRSSSRQLRLPKITVMPMFFQSFRVGSFDFDTNTLTLLPEWDHSAFHNKLNKEIPYVNYIGEERI